MTRYNNVAVALHWVMAVLVLLQIYVGFTFGNMERGPERGLWFDWHKTLGATILVLALLRLWWRIANPPPPLPADMPGWEKALSRAVHFLFYVGLIGLPLTGWATISTGGSAQESAFTTLVGGIPFPFIPGLPRESHDAFETGHKLLVWTAITLAVLHVSAALKHQFVDQRYNGRMPPL